MDLSAGGMGELPITGASTWLVGLGLAALLAGLGFRIATKRSRGVTASE